MHLSVSRKLFYSVVAGRYWGQHLLICMVPYYVPRFREAGHNPAIASATWYCVSGRRGDQSLEHYTAFCEGAQANYGNRSNHF